MAAKKSSVDSGGSETAGKETGAYRRFIVWAVQNCLPMPPRRNEKISTEDELMALGWLSFFVFAGVFTSPVWLPLLILREGLKLLGAIFDSLGESWPRGRVPFSMD